MTCKSELIMTAHFKHFEQKQYMINSTFRASRGGLPARSIGHLRALSLGVAAGRSASASGLLLGLPTGAVATWVPAFSVPSLL